MSPASSQSVASGVAQPAEVSQQEFLQHINAMQQHYRAIDPTVGQSINAYLLPAHLTIALPHVSADAGTKPTVPQAQQSPGYRRRKSQPREPPRCSPDWSLSARRRATWGLPAWGNP